MTLPDLLTSASGNLWRMKLRASLTISGVVIAIAAFVSMLSFGAGMQKNVSEQFNDLGLFSTLLVYPADDGKPAADSLGTAILNEQAVNVLAAIPGVNLAYPYDDFSVTAAVGDTQVTTHAQALPDAAIQTKLFSQLAAGSVPSGDSTKDALITEELLRLAGIGDPDSVVGTRLIVSEELLNLDSGVARFLRHPFGNWRERLAGVALDSLKHPEYSQRILYRELGVATARFAKELFTSKVILSDTLVIRGVLKGGHGGSPRRGPVIVPLTTALRFKSGGFSDDPTDLIASLKSGSLLGPSGDLSGETYPRVTLDLNPLASYEAIRDSVKSLGYETFSFAEQFKEIRRFFFYFNLALGVVGMIALVTASLGIVNTMVMSILERTREIGVLKSLGADDRDIRLLFLAESGMIGTIGAALGIAVGWGISRIASFVAHIVMEREKIPEMEMFALPWWLIAIALLFGLLVSLGAGLYPATRAARIDPVQALRSE